MVKPDYRDYPFYGGNLKFRVFDNKGSSTLYLRCYGLFLLLISSLVALSIGFLILFLHPYDAIFEWKSTLADGGEIYEMWRKPEVGLYTRVYLFNVTNAEEYLAGQDTKLKLKEVGPFVYREFLEHSEVKFNDNGTLTSIPKHPLVWQEELSMGNKEDDILFLPHIALLSIANVVSEQSFMARFGINNIIRMTDSQPLAKMTAREFMMGYKSELMTLGNTFLPGWIYFDKLGLIDRMYDFEGDYETIFTGETDVSLSGLIDTYRGSTDLPQWEGKHCSNVQYASDGTKFRGAVKPNDSLLFYRKSLCRAAPLIKSGEGTKNGISAYKYTFPEHMLDNGKQIEENKCFCRKGKCLPEGLIDVSDCYYGFPIALSYPHFYKSDDILFSKVEGLVPDKEKHETSFWINPHSGLPVDVSSKFQINMALGDISAIQNTDKFANMYLPLLWFDIRMYELPARLEQRFKLYLNILPIVEQVLMYISFISGVILTILASYVLIFKIMFKSHRPNKKLSNFNVKANIWMEREKNHTHDKEVYTPCEVPLKESISRHAYVNAHNNRLRKLSHMLSDKVFGSVNNIRDKFDDFTHGKTRNDRKNSLINPEDSQDENNDAYKSDSGEDSEKGTNTYQSDSEDGAYLEVIDDGSEFDET